MTPPGSWACTKVSGTNKAPVIIFDIGPLLKVVSFCFLVGNDADERCTRAQ